MRSGTTVGKPYTVLRHVNVFLSTQLITRLINTVYKKAIQSECIYEQIDVEYVLFA